MKLKIKVTKEVLEATMMCGVLNNRVSENCAISYAVREIFPLASVSYFCILPFGFQRLIIIPIPQEAIDFINAFDKLSIHPPSRLDLPELEFEIEVPESLIDEINIEDIKNSKTLELVA